MITITKEHHQENLKDVNVDFTELEWNVIMYYINTGLKTDLDVLELADALHDETTDDFRNSFLSDLNPELLNEETEKILKDKKFKKKIELLK